jgi:hypothetical protein
MGYSLLAAVNATLKRVKIISGVNGQLTSLTDSPRQTYIDTAVQIINEGMHELYSTAEKPLPTESATANITLATGTREYDLPADFEAIRFPLIDTTNGNFIIAYPGGYERMRLEQLQPANYTGQPQFAVISPVTGKLRFERAPTATENGRIYELLYDKRLSLTAAADTFPFSDTVVDSLVPAWGELWKREQRNSFDQVLFDKHFGRASRYLSQVPMRRKW